MKIGEVYGNSNNKLLKSISSSGKSMFIDFKKQYEFCIFIPPFILLLLFEINKYWFSWTWYWFQKFVIWISIYFSNFHVLFMSSIINIKSIIPISDLHKETNKNIKCVLIFMAEAIQNCGKTTHIVWYLRCNSYIKNFKFQVYIMFVIYSWY